MVHLKKISRFVTFEALGQVSFAPKSQLRNFQPRLFKNSAKHQSDKKSFLAKKQKFWKSTRSELAASEISNPIFSLKTLPRFVSIFSNHDRLFFSKTFRFFANSHSVLVLPRAAQLLLCIRFLQLSQHR